MKKLLFAIGALALGLTVAAPAHADYAIVQLQQRLQPIWPTPPWPRKAVSWFVWGHYRYNRLPTLAIAKHQLHPWSHGACAGTIKLCISVQPDGTLRLTTHRTRGSHRNQKNQNNLQ